MHLRLTARFISILIFFLGLSMGFPLAASLFYKDGCTTALLSSILLACGAGAIGFAATKERETTHLSHRDGIAVVSFGWIMACLFGSLPYLLSNTIPGFTDAYFESVSGFTTTGASILSDIESLPPGILLWRSESQWLGGMGIIVFSIAILPFLGVGGMQLYKAEIPSPVVDKLKPRISETAKTLWKVYLFITVLEIILLYIGGMPLFDAVCHAFCTMPTGGFSTKNASIAYYNNSYFEWTIIIFMLLAGVNFSLHYKLLKGDYKVFGKDPECRFFLGLVLLCVLVISATIHGQVYSVFSEALRYGAFQVSSIITTTGFVTADYDQWPVLSKHILLFCMFVGAMAGSTGGGMKTMRIMLLGKHAYREMLRIVHPHAVTTVKLGKAPVAPEVMGSIWGFFVLYLGVFVSATLIMAALGLDLVSSFASVAASIGNIGPGLGSVGPVKNFLGIPVLGKWVLIFCMLLGRLEIYTVIVLFAPEFWRK